MLLERLRHARETLTGRERKIAATLEGGYPHAGLESATALGERVGVSAATVVRLAAKLGYGGYADLQRELRQEVEARLATPLQRLEQSTGHEPAQSVGDDVAARTFEVALSVVTRSYGALDRAVLNEMTSALIGCRGRVLILGEKKARSIAVYLFAQLNLCLPRVALLTTDGNFEGDQLLDIGPDDVLLAIDVRRYVKRGVAAAEWAASRGARLVVLADSVAAPLYQLTQMRLCAATNSAGAFDSYVGLMLMADILSNTVVAKNPQVAKARLVLGEEAWERLGVFRPEASAGKSS